MRWGESVAPLRPGDQDDDWLDGDTGIDWGDSRDVIAGAAPGRGIPSWIRAGANSGPSDGDDDPDLPPETPADVVRRRRLAAAGVVALLALAGVAIAVVTSGGSDKGGAPVATTNPTLPEVTPPASTTTPTTVPETSAPTTPETSAPTTPSTSVPTVELPTAGMLKAGDFGDLVLNLQKALAAVVLSFGTPDGKFGPATRDAVIAFQKAQGLEPDGIVGAGTVEKLNAAVASGTTVSDQAQTETPTIETPVSSVELPAAGVLKVGDTGDLVLSLQKALAQLDLAVGTPDGAFGPVTRDAVIAFQKAQGLEPDGIVGAGTVEKLNANLAGSGLTG